MEVVRLSVVAVTVITTYSLIKLLAVAGGIGAVSAGLSASDFFARRREEREAVKNNIETEIAASERRLDKFSDSSSADGLRAELEKIRNSIDERLTDENALRAIFVEMNDLSLKIKRAELDEALCRERTESIRSMADSIRTGNIEGTKPKLARIEEEIEEIAVLPAEDRLAGLMRIQETLADLQRSQNLPVTGSTYDTGDPDAQERVRMTSEIRDLADRISRLDDAEGERLRPLLETVNTGTHFPDRVAGIRRQLRTIWGSLRERISSTSFFRDTLMELRHDLASACGAAASDEGAKLIERLDRLCGGKFIERTDFMTLYEDIAKFVNEHGEKIADSIFAGKIKSVLSELGYELLPDAIAEEAITGGEENPYPELTPGTVRYMRSPIDGYRVMIKIGPGGSLATRLVRTATDGDGENSSDADQETQDRAAGGKWCRDFDGFLGKMRESGVPLSVKIRKEPHETKVLTVEDQNMAGKIPRRKSRKNSGLEERSLLEHGNESR
jgi:hypothetical protein